MDHKAGKNKTKIALPVDSGLDVGRGSVLIRQHLCYSRYLIACIKYTVRMLIMVEWPKFGHLDMQLEPIS